MVLHTGQFVSSAFLCKVYGGQADFNLDLNLIGWLIDNLMSRLQSAQKIAPCRICLCVCVSVGSPQGWCLSPLYISYTDQRLSRHKDRHVLKSADDLVIVSLRMSEVMGLTLWSGVMVYF